MHHRRGCVFGNFGREQAGLIRSGRRICHLASSWIRERGENVKWKRRGKGKNKKKSRNATARRPGIGILLVSPLNEEKQRLVRRASPDASKITRWTACSAAPPKGSSPFPICASLFAKGHARCVSGVVECVQHDTARRLSLPVGPESFLPTSLPQLRAIRVPPLSRDRVSQSFIMLCRSALALR
jgi:hypothetical protein